MTEVMTRSAARRASKKTQHVRSVGDWATLIILIAAALLVLFPLLVLTVNAFKTSADYNAAGPLSLPKHSASAQPRRSSSSTPPSAKPSAERSA